MVSRVACRAEWRRWRFLFVAPLVLVLGLLVGPGVARASGTLDQSQTTVNTFAPIAGPDAVPPQSDAQTFTAGLTGGLDRVDLYLGNNQGATAPLTVEIRNTSGGAPAPSVLASASVPAASVPSAGFVEVDFASPAPVVSGAQYAIVAYTADTNTPASYGWGGNDQDPYSGGALWFSLAWPPATWFENSADDLAFKTYVESTSDLAATLVTDSTGVGPGRALFDQASAIQSAVNAGDSATACADITNYLALVKAQTGKKLTTAQAQQLTTDADNLKAALGC